MLQDSKFDALVSIGADKGASPPGHRESLGVSPPSYRESLGASPLSHRESLTLDPGDTSIDWGSCEKVPVSSESHDDQVPGIQADSVVRFLGQTLDLIRLK